MERSEPTLVPEWLRCSGNATGGGSSSHHFASSSLRSDDSSSAVSKQIRSSRSIGDKNGLCSSFLDRASSLNSRRSPISNGSPKHPYSSFTRNHRDRNRDKEKDKPFCGDLWDNDLSNSFEGHFTNRVDKNILKRSQSLVSRKAGDVLSRGEIDYRNGTSGGNGIFFRGGGMGGIQKTTFEKDFPSLGSEEKPVHDIGRIPSPGLTASVQSLSVGIGGGHDKWTSALAEVPLNIGSSNVGNSSVPKSAIIAPYLGNSSACASLNMAEALSQTPSRTRMTTQVLDKTHRLEELAIKQSRQLIPMIPSTSKSLVLNSDKAKQPKTPRTGEMSTTKTVQQHPANSSQFVNHSLRGGQRADSSKSSHTGKFLVLKPVWENGLSSTAKDVSMTSAASGGASTQLSVATSAPTGPNCQNVSTLEQKEAALSLNLMFTHEKKPSVSQTQSRSDFFNLIRKKTSISTSSVLLNSSTSSVEKSCQAVEDGSSMCEDEDFSKIPNSIDPCEECQGFLVAEKNGLSINGVIYPDEEEAAFLRSLGWEENAGEDEGLTEEEISAFYQEYMKLRPSEPRNAVSTESKASNSTGSFSEMSLSKSDSLA